MQKIGAQYVLKKITDQVMAPSKEPEQAAEAAEEPVRPSGPDTVLVEDEEGNQMLAYRLDVAVYAVTRGRGRPEAALARSLEGDNGQVMVQREGSRITGIIYVPEPGDEPRGEATRAEDI
jgi:hypothetical protein